MTAAVIWQHSVLPGDVCDQGECPAAVQVAVLTPAGPLGFCIHHTNHYADGLAGYPAVPVSSN